MNDANKGLPTARYVMIGGFLGAGKSTAVIKLARWLSERGLRVGLITNDQGNQLVDTALISAHGFPVEEIPGGCFCCRFNSLVDAARHLSVQAPPEVFLAEPVGSCTDLVATVSYPLRRIYGASFTIAPLSVMIDPVRALRVLGLEAGGKFSEKVSYIYRKQLEEADWIVINKCDLLDAARLAALRETLATHFPHAKRFEVSARYAIGLEPWFDQLLRNDQAPRAIMDLDYEGYANGEAKLGWFNGTARLDAPAAFDGNLLLEQLAAEIQRRLIEAGAEVAHLKMTLESEGGLGDLGVINLVRNDYVPELSQNLIDPLLSGRLIVNLRAEAAPEVLRRTVLEAVADRPKKNLPSTAQPRSGAVGPVEQPARRTAAVTVKWEHVESFQPGKPSPTHRMGPAG